MPTERQSWKIITESVRGPSHDRLALPNQDSIKAAECDMIVAISDGHGSTKSFRSDSGSRIAVDTAIDTLEKFVSGDWSGASFSDKKTELELRLPKMILQEWRSRVDFDLQAFPIRAEERQLLASQEGDYAIQHIETNPHLCYGATLLAVAITDEYLIYLQLGDGDILSVYDSGDVERLIPNDERLFGNETTSLCSKSAWSNFRTYMQPASERLPSLILMATDGYGNSFKDDASFLSAGKDFLNLLRSEGGVAEVESHLAQWLRESAEMSGDDVTVGLLFCERGSSVTSTTETCDSQTQASISHHAPEPVDLNGSEPVPHHGNISKQEGATETGTE